MPSAAGYPRPIESTQEVAERHTRVIEIAPAQGEPRSWKAVRICVALPLIALSGGALFPFAVVPVSTQAVVNARLSEVRSPIQGNIQEITFETGDIVSANEPLARVRTVPFVAVTQREQTDRTVRDLESRAAEIDSELAASEQQLTQSNKTASSYALHLAANLQFQLQVAQKDQQRAESKLAQLDQEAKRDTQAAQAHLVPRSVAAEASERAERAQQEAQAAAIATAHLQKQLSDVEGGYLMGADSQSPVFIQQRDSAAAEVTRLTGEKQGITAQLAQIQKTTNADDQSAPKAVLVRSPVSGPIWSRSGSPTQSVVEGDDIYRVADAASIHVEVWLDRRYGPQLSIGDVALVYLGGMGKELTGHVVSFQGSSRRRLDEEVNAIDLQPVHPDQYHVTIELDPADRKAVYIGQAAKVIFPGSKGQLKAKIYSWLARL